MKISLNKEMLEKIKSLKGKMVLATAAFTLGAGLTLAGCGNADAIEPTTPVTSEVVSEEVSEIVSEEISEEVSEEISEEVVEEVDYSAEAVMALTDELIAKYPNENPDYIRSLVIGMNIDHMDAADVDMVMSTYGYTFEQLNENFVAILEEKRDVWESRDAYMVGDVDSYENKYENNIMAYECCLNKDEYDECKKFEELIAYGDKEEIKPYIINTIENYDNSDNLDYVVIMIGVSPDYRTINVPGFDVYDNTISQYANTLTK